MHSLENPMNQLEKYLDPQLWHACAGGMAQIPPLNSNVYYFPQGHAEHAVRNVDFRRFPRISPIVPCRVSSIKYLADSETDEVYTKIGLVPLRVGECDIDGEVGLMGFDRNEEKEKLNSFAKTLTQSDANNGGGFSVPRYCAETIFPRLDYNAEPPVQTILAKDAHGEVWKFRHIYRGTPRRHLLTTGWSNFVNQKKLVAGDSIVFLRAENGDLCVGIRRAKMGIGGGLDVSSGWNTGAANGASSMYKGFYGFPSENGLKKGNDECDLGVKEKGNVRVESVIEAAHFAANGQPFEVVYYPRASTPEFVVRSSVVRAAMRVQWCPGMRFKMAFETEDSSRISWFTGIISSVMVDDPIHWPNSPWRLLQAAWDEAELLQNVKRVNPWLVELVSNIPPIHLSPFSQPQPIKRPRLHSEFPFGQLPMSTLLSNPLSPSSPLCCFPDNISTGIQGARHAEFVLSSSDLDINKLRMGLRPFDFKQLDYAVEHPKFVTGNPLAKSNSDTSPDRLKMQSSASYLKKPNEETNKARAPVFLLFGQPILTEQQISQSYSMNSSSDGNHDNIGTTSNASGSAVIQNSPPEASSDEEFPRLRDQKLEPCKVFMESEDVGRTLDLSTLRSYEELYRELGSMFGRLNISSNVVYSNAAGTTKHIGDKPFDEFVRKARRITFLTDSSSSDNHGNK